MLTSFSARTIRGRCVRWAFLVAALAAGVGCASKEFSYLATVSGGEQMKFTFAKGAPVHAKSDGFEIQEASIRPDMQAKKVFYGFSMSDSANGKSLQSVRVEDVSDAAPVLLLEDAQPTVTNRQWSGTSRAFSGDDSALDWISYVNNSVRIYRFTLTMKDGRTVVLHQPSVVPGWMKASMRELVGRK